MKKQLGFSIFEVLIAIGIISVIGIIASNLLTRTYRTNSITETMGKLKQNGDVVSNTLSEAIRMADSVVCYGLQNQWIVIRTMQGTYDLYRFTAADSVQNTSITRQENLRPEDSPNFCTANPPIFKSETYLTDKNLTKGVSICNGSFLQSSTSVGSDGLTKKDTVGIVFDVVELGQVCTPNPDPARSVRIQTTVKVR